jgi:hypothetical protein
VRELPSRRLRGYLDSSIGRDGTELKEADPGITIGWQFGRPPFPGAKVGRGRSGNGSSADFLLRTTKKLLASRLLRVTSLLLMMPVT